jgi:hypothetical protein
MRHKIPLESIAKEIPIGWHCSEVAKNINEFQAAGSFSHVDGNRRLPRVFQEWWTSTGSVAP